ncbi:MAG: SMC-Scp complex subunit ScpB [Candidatus Marinimicrobia bacterium]|nr:SMC-Scp complex subunit ScpB [Candidatus Neomarinimicrobiota bacterium]
MQSEELLQITEALLMATSEPLTKARFRQSVEYEDIELEDVIERLQARFVEQERPVEIVFVAGGYQLVTRSEYQPFIERLFQKSGRLTLTRAALETLAMVAYRQPVTKVEIDQLRGVNSDSVLRTLLEKELVTITGREETVGRPLLYSTTQHFLEAFGLGTLSDMPKLKEIKEIMGDSGSAVPVANAPE